MEAKFRMEFSPDCIESWTTYNNSTNGLNGIIVLKNFLDAFNFLVKSTCIEGVKISNPLYVDWSWMKKTTHTEFYDAINENLNDDCIREVINWLDLRYLIYFGHINLRFNELAKEKMKLLNICPLNIGLIDVMNLRYMLYLSENSLQTLRISIHSIPTIFGIHPMEKKEAVLQTVLHFAGTKLKRLQLQGFHIDKNMKLLLLFNMLMERGVTVEEQHDESNSIPSLDSVSRFSSSLQKFYH